MDHSTLVHEVRDRSSHNWPTRKGSNRNTAAIAAEMPFAVGVLFSDDFDGM
jgi:hypothetical protein